MSPSSVFTWPTREIICSAHKGADVSYPSTNQDRLCLASKIRRDQLHSGWYGHKGCILVITGPLPIRLVPACSQSDLSGMESRVPNTVFPQNPIELWNLPLLQKVRLAAGQSSIILYCNKIFECVYSYFLQSFHFVFNINGLSQIQ